MQDQVVCIFYC